MYYLLQNKIVITESKDPILYNDHERAWFANNTYYCDPDKEMVVEFAEPAVVTDGGPNVVA